MRTSLGQAINSHGNTLTSDDQSRLRQMVSAYDAYWGRMPRELKVKPGKPDDNITINYSRLFVDKKAAFLFGRGVSFEIDEQRETDEEQWLDSIWRRVKKQTFLHNCAVSGGIHGHCFLKIVLPATYRVNKRPQPALDRLTDALAAAQASDAEAPDARSSPNAEASEEPTEAHPQKQPTKHQKKKTPSAPIAAADQVKLVLVNPMTIKVEWNEDDIDQVDQYVIMSTSSRRNEQGKRQTVLKRQRIIAQRPNDDSEQPPTHWLILDEEMPLAKYLGEDLSPGKTASAQQRGRMSQMVANVMSTLTGQTDMNNQVQDQWDEVKREVWPWPFSPIVHCQNMPAPNEFWGVSELEDDHIHVQRKINFAWSTVMKIWRYHGFPVVWGRGFAAGQMKKDIDEVLVLQSHDAALNTLPAADPIPGIDIIQRLTTILHMIGKIPQLALGDPMSTGGLQYSGVALRLAYAPMLEANRLKQDLYGDMLEQLCARLLVIGGWRRVEEHDRITITATWPDPLPVDEAAERSNMQIDETLGVSRDTMFKRIGLDWETEKEKRKKEMPDIQALQPAPPEPPGGTEGPEPDGAQAPPPPGQPEEPVPLGMKEKAE